MYSTSVPTLGWCLITTLCLLTLSAKCQWPEWPPPADAPQCDSFHNTDRFDCYPEVGATQQLCEARNCCWRTPTQSRKHSGDAELLNVTFDIPYCFYPSNFGPRYTMSSSQNTNRGFTQTLSKSQPIQHWPNDLLTIQLDVIYISNTVVRLRLTDPKTPRFEPPIPLNIPTSVPSAMNYKVVTPTSPFYTIQVIRSSGSSNLTVFDTSLPGAPLIYADQFLQITTRVPSTNLYGLGEQRRPFQHDLSKNWEQIALYARDQPPTPNVNLYGTHNFFVGLTDQAEAYGIFFLNSDAQEILLQPTPSVTYRTIGGIMDFFIFTAPNAEQVIGDYWSLIGSPMLPPYWALGFHLCRYGYKSSSEVQQVVERQRQAKIPQDVQWSDIDYMDKYYMWTVDPQNYGNFGSVIKNFQSQYNLRYVLILDPGVGNQRPGQYAPYDEGLKREVFITQYNQPKEVLVGKVWPGLTVFPDFGNPRTYFWWLDICMRPFHDNVAPFDGLWIDMNEPSSFVDGSTVGCPPNNPYDNPPYATGILGNSLIQKTICASSQTYYGPMYHVHNLYGYLEANCTHAAMTQVFPNQRVFLLSRSTFAGSGRYTFHWTGDNQASWDNMYYSISQILNFNLFGIPFVGADICGFINDSNEELCTRWMQLGAFYPFMRNHNDIHSRDQDPAVWSGQAQDRMREALRVRYSLLPYLYTWMFAASAQNKPVFRPLWMDFPTKDTFSIDTQFMLGSSVMVAPVLAAGVSSRQVLQPAGAWCDLRTLARVVVGSSQTVAVNVNMDSIPAYIRGGSILPVQGLDWDIRSKNFIHTNPDALNTEQYRQLPLSLVVCLDAPPKQLASGQLVWDDGVSLDALQNQVLDQYNFTFDGGNNLFTSAPVTFNYKNADQLKLAKVYFVGVTGKPTAVKVNNQPASQVDFNDNILVVTAGSLDVGQKITINW